ncbi:cobalamin B12-binding domain-containing protein [Kitasatospora sp. NPDC004531]
MTVQPLAAPAAPHLTRRTGAADLADWRDRLWTAVLDGDQSTAAALALGALESGLDPEALLLDVIAPVQARIGREWAADRISVVQEHAATAVNDRVVALLSGHPAFVAAEPRPTRGRVTVACVDGEWHAFPARLLTEVLVLRGWKVDYLGAQCPTPHLIAHLHRTAPDALALSASLSARLPVAHAAITAAQAAGVPVMAGGAAFGPDGRHAFLLGADAWARDARDAAVRLAAGLPVPDSPHPPIDALPHLVDQEYTLVSRSSRQLVAAVMAALEREFAPVRSYTELQREHTLADLGHIVEQLAVSLYMGDPELFTGFLGWTTDVLTARRVPPTFLAFSLRVLAGELRDLPRSVATLAAVRPASTEAGSPS